jgi:hypothetical protein
MAQRSVSRAVNVVCKMAATEAVAAGSLQVEPLHLLIGICSLEKLFAPRQRGETLSRSELDGIGLEWSLTMSVFADVAINPILLRRTLRGPAKSKSSSCDSIQLSPPSSRILEQAATNAIDRNFSRAGLLELLLALLDDENVVSRLQAAGVDVARVLTHLFARSEASASMPEFHDNRSLGGQSLDNIFGALSDTFSLERSGDNERVAIVPPSEDHHSFARLALLFEACCIEDSGESSDKLAQKVLEQLVATVPSAHRGVILTTDASSGGLLLKAHFPAGSPVVSVSSAREAIERRSAFIWTTEKHKGASEGLYAPLAWKNQVLGVICLDNGIGGASFNRGDIDLLSSFGHHLAVVLVNC